VERSHWHIAEIVRLFYCELPQQRTQQRHRRGT
jgi:hypothetical protein